MESTTSKQAAQAGRSEQARQVRRWRMYVDVCKCVSRQGTGGETPQQRDHAVCRMRWRTRMRENTTDGWEKKEEKQRS